LSTVVVADRVHVVIGHNQRVLVPADEELGLFRAALQRGELDYGRYRDGVAVAQTQLAVAVAAEGPEVRAAVAAGAGDHRVLAAAGQHAHLRASMEPHGSARGEQTLCQQNRC
jgi:hypothetical protein